MKEAKVLISAIESYQLENKKYPDSLKQLVPTFIDKISSPRIIGITEFRYDKIDSIYEIVFDQNVIMNFNYEVVIYNPNATQKGYGEIPFLYNTSDEKWKYFIID